MRYRLLGNTGLEVSEVGFGAIPIIRLSFAEAEQVLRRALERGINFYDTAHLYVDSEEKIGRAFAGQRRQVLLASKTIKRDRQGAREDLELSLRRLGTDYLDLYQLHQVSQDSDWETLTGPDGALEYLTQARQAGRIRHLGVTSHSLEMAIRLVQTGLFSTIQFPFNFVETEATKATAPPGPPAAAGHPGHEAFLRRPGGRCPSRFFFPASVSRYHPFGRLRFRGPGGPGSRPL